MSQIVEKMRQEIIDRSARFEEQTKGTKDEYNIYREHIQYVYKYVVMLSKDRNVDREVLELAALLHDISMTDMALDRSRHNEYGAEIAEQLLRENNYPEDKTQLVKRCILNHSKRRQQYRSTEEEQILVDADGLSHFDVVKTLYSLPSKVMGLSEEDSVRFVQDKLTGDYNELSDDLKYLVKEKYDRVMAAKCADDMISSLTGKIRT
ncbi:MAG: HD domain-containing protein [Lachnospiraceae bacterium]|nr:HD domain-containing protein [Lachnospiraceae bacterium]